MAGDNPAAPDAAPIPARPPRSIRPALNQEVVNQIDVSNVSEFQSMLDLDSRSLDGEFTYRWANVAPLKVARWKSRGYVIVSAEEEPDIKNAVGDAPAAEDGTYRVGDLVLMKVPRTIRKARKVKLAKVRDRRLKGPEKSFRTKASKRGRRYSAGVEVITDEKDPQRRSR